MPPRLPRYDPHHHTHSTRNVDRAVGESETNDSTYIGRAGGDKRQLRGIPVVGSSSGAMPNTDPVQALLDQEQQTLLP